MTFAEHPIPVFLVVSGISGLVLAIALVGFWLCWRCNRRQSETVGREPIPDVDTVPANQVIGALGDDSLSSDPSDIDPLSSSSDDDALPQLDDLA